MSITVEQTIADLRSADPRDRLAGIRRMIKLVAQPDLDPLPVLLASIDAVAVADPAGGPVPPHTIPVEAHLAWQMAVDRYPRAVSVLFATMLDLVLADWTVPADAALGRRLLTVLLGEPWAKPDGAATKYTPFVREQAPRLLARLTELRAEGDPRTADLLTLVWEHSAQGDEILVALAERAVELYPLRPEPLHAWITLVRYDHPEPMGGLVALLDMLLAEHPKVAGLAFDHLLLTTHDRNAPFDLTAFAECLRPVAARWSDQQIDVVVGAALLGSSELDSRAGLEIKLRREPTRTAVPRMLLGLGRSTPALAKLATVLAAADRPLPPPSPVPADAVEFVDDAFKLAVIEELMFRQGLLERFDVYAFAKSYPYAELSPSDCGGVLEPVWEHVVATPLTPDLLAGITTLTIDATGQIWNALSPGWDGEDDVCPRTFDDVVHLPNLRRIVIEAFVEEDVDFSAARRRGIDIEVDEDY